LQPWQERQCSHDRSESAALAAQQQQQLSYYSSAAPAAQQFAAIPAQTALQPCSHAALQPNSPAARICSLAAPGNSPAALQPYGLAVPMQSLKT